MSRRTHRRPCVEVLEDRATPAVTLAFDSATGTLIFLGDASSDTIVLSSDSAGAIFLNDASTGHRFGGVRRIGVIGGDGNDDINLAGLDTTRLTEGAVVRGGAGSDTVRGGKGNDTLDGGAGDDRVLATSFGASVTLDDTFLLSSRTGFDTLISFERASVFAQFAERVDASGFSGNARLEGGRTVVGGSGDDLIISIDFDTNLDGGPGNDHLQRGVNDDAVLTDGLLREPDLLVPQTHRFVNIERLTVVLHPGVELDVSDFTGVADVAMDSLAEGGRVRSQLVADQLIVDNHLLRPGRPPIGLLGNLGVVLVGSDGRNVLDASDTDLPTTLIGGGGDDRLIGGRNADSLVGGSGDDTLTGGPGDDTLSGAFGSDDLVLEQGDVPFSLRDDRLTGLGTDTLAFINRAVLTGGPGDNRLDAAGFTGRVTLHGGDGADTLVGGHGHDSLLGDGGDDVLTGGGGNDTLHGGLGTDAVQETVASGGNLTLTNATLTGRGTDTLISLHRAELRGDSGTNRLDAGGFSFGPVTLVGGGGNDTLLGTLHDDRLDGGDDNDSLLGGDGDDTLTGGLGVDVLHGGGGVDVQRELGNGNYTLVGTTTSATATGGFGGDQLAHVERAHITGGTAGNVLDASGFSGVVVFEGGGGNDTLRGGALADTLLGGTGDDVLDGNGNNDRLDGGSGTDTLFDEFVGDPVLTDTAYAVGGAIDTLISIERAALTASPLASRNDRVDASGFSGQANLFGGGGNDTLIGGSGPDGLDGGFGHDSLVGGGGNDTFTGGGGDDTVLGGDGDDLVTVTVGADVIDLGAGADGIVVDGTAGPDVIVVRREVRADGPHVVLWVNGQVVDVVYHNGETVTVRGHGGHDRIAVDASVTTWRTLLDGGAGNDTLIGGPGIDTLVGGAGRDQFHARDGRTDTIHLDHADVLVEGDPVDEIVRPARPKRKSPTA